MQENDVISFKKPTSKTPLMVWKTPPENMVRINFNAVFGKHRSRFATGLVIKDDKGGVVTSKSLLHDQINSPFATEATACSHAVKLGMELGLLAVEIEGDALTVFRKCQSHVVDKSKIGAFI